MGFIRKEDGSYLFYGSKEQLEQWDNAIKEYIDFKIVDNKLKVNNMSKHRMIEKTDSDCNVILVEDPANYNDEGMFQKIRHKPTNITPKKKKRRK
jgi:hypothetical protein